MTYPILGLQLGHLAQSPQLKPRLPLEFTVFDDKYPADFSLAEFKDYDKLVHQYYDLRDTDRRVDEFTTQIGSKKLAAHKSSRDEIMAAIQDQGLCLD